MLSLPPQTASRPPRQLPLPLPLVTPIPPPLPPDVATLPVRHIWPTLATPLQAQVRRTLLHIVQEVLAHEHAHLHP